MSIPLAFWKPSAIPSKLKLPSSEIITKRKAWTSLRAVDLPSSTMKLVGSHTLQHVLGCSACFDGLKKR